jgi:hypothetical protein
VVIPPHDRRVAQRHIIDVEQHLIGALLVPDLTTGVTRVGKDHPHSALGPGQPSRWRFRARSCADGQGMSSWVRASAMAKMPYPARYMSKIRWTTGAVCRSGASRAGGAEAETRAQRGKTRLVNCANVAEAQVDLDRWIHPNTAPHGDV